MRVWMLTGSQSIPMAGTFCPKTTREIERCCVIHRYITGYLHITHKMLCVSQIDSIDIVVVMTNICNMEFVEF